MDKIEDLYHNAHSLNSHMQQRRKDMEGIYRREYEHRQVINYLKKVNKESLTKIKKK